MLKKILIVAFAVLNLIIFSKFFLLTQSKGKNSEFVYEVKPGTGLNKVLLDMQDKEILSDLTLAKFIAKFLGYDKRIRVGEYKIPKTVSFKQFLEIVSSGKSIEYKMTIPEGTNMYEIAEQIEKMELGSKQKFIQICKDKLFIQELLKDPNVKSLEGYLFPETYLLTKFTSEKQIAKLMVERFLAVLSQIPKNALYKKMGRHKVVTLASIIEKETGAPEERPLISSVFHNRLAKNMRLQTDPTIIYGILQKSGVMPSNIRKKDILEPTDYNTYTIFGLPPGPISSPGQLALEATLYPEKSDYLYFVSKNEGRHYFSKTYDEHKKAVEKYQLNSKMRQGKSWRNMK